VWQQLQELFDPAGIEAKIPWKLPEDGAEMFAQSQQAGGDKVRQGHDRVP